MVNYMAPMASKFDWRDIYSVRDPVWTNSLRKKFKLGKFITAAGKSIRYLVELSSLVTKYCKMWRI